MVRCQPAERSGAVRQKYGLANVTMMIERTSRFLLVL